MASFNEYGLLPAGIHRIDPAEFEKLFGFNPRRRDMIEKGLKPFLGEIAAYAVKTVYVDGSFVTTKENPSDIDTYIITDSSSELCDFICNQYEKWKLEYRMDVQIAFTDFEGDSSEEYWRDWFSTTASSEIRKGFVALEK